MAIAEETGIEETVKPPERGRQLRILFLANSAEIGGGNRSLLTLATGLRKIGNFPTVVSPCPGPIVDACLENSLPCEVVDYVQPGWRELPSTWIAFRRWQKLLQEGKIDVIHANGVESARSIALVARKMKIPLVCHIRFYVEPEQASWLFRLLGAPDVFIFNSYALQTSVGEFFNKSCAESLQTVIYNAVCPDQFYKNNIGSDIKSSGAVRGNRMRVGIIANLIPIKGHLDFLNMAAQLKERDVAAEYWVIGDDIHQTGYGQELKEKSRSLGLEDCVSFLGHCDNVPWLINELDVIVCASHVEPFGRCLIESMACEKPVVATSVGGIPEVVENGVTGIVVKPHAPHELANAVMTLLDQEDLRRGMGQAGRNRVLKMFTQDSHIHQVLQVYENLLNCKKK